MKFSISGLDDPFDDPPIGASQPLKPFYTASKAFTWTEDELGKRSAIERFCGRVFLWSSFQTRNGRLILHQV